MRSAIPKAQAHVQTALKKAGEATAKQFLSVHKDDNDDYDLDALGGIAGIDELLSEVATDSGKSFLAQLNLPGESDLFDQVNDRAVAYAKARAAELVTGVDDATRNELKDIISDGLEENIGMDAIADNIRGAYAFSEDRAELIARNEVATANQAGALEGMKAAKGAGVKLQKVWVPDADACDICQDNADDGPIDLDDQFSSGDDSPTAHPNAVFEGHSFASYGSLHQLLRSRYDGPAITIEATLDKNCIKPSSGNASSFPNLALGDILVEQCDSMSDLIFRNNSGSIIGVCPQRKVFTIGPNHPMLTNRGFIKAAELKEGDQLLYDIRCHISASGIESDFKQVPMIEDAFETLRPVFGNSLISAPRSYFHGDEAFIYGEVDAIRPTRDLLPVLDACGVEKLAEFYLPRSDANTEGMASFGTSYLFLKTLFAPPDSSVSGRSQNLSLFGSSSRPPHFQTFTITSNHNTSFSGFAFDASTATAIYASGGFVVKNCECSLSSEVEDEEGSETDEDDDE